MACDRTPRILFAVELLAALELVDEATRERRRRFYRGEIMPSLPQPEPR